MTVAHQIRRLYPGLVLTRGWTRAACQSCRSRTRRTSKQMKGLTQSQVHLTARVGGVQRFPSKHVSVSQLIIPTLIKQRGLGGLTGRCYNWRTLGSGRAGLNPIIPNPDRQRVGGRPTTLYFRLMTRRHRGHEVCTWAC